MVDHSGHAALARKHLDRRFERLGDPGAWTPPPRGWLRAIRDALGMTSRQFAVRLGVAQSTAVALERGEIDSSITLRRLRDAAEALDCTLVYALVPRRPLQTVIGERARMLADEQLARTHHTMRLEDQALDSRDLAAERERLVAAYLADRPSRLWDAP